MVLNILCRLEWVIKCSSGWVRQCLRIIISVSVVVIFSVERVKVISEVVLLLVVSSGIIVISGIVVIFWNSSIVKVFCFICDIVRLCLFIVCIVMVVEESVRVILISLVICQCRFSSMQNRLINILQVIICSVLLLNIEVCSFYKCCGLSFRLMMNNISIMLILVKCRIVLVLVISCSVYGLIIQLVMRQFSIDFSFRWMVMGIISVVVLR